MADIQYLNYGDLQIELLALLNTLANNVQSYVAKQPWSNKRKEKFMSAYSDIMNKGLKGASNTSGQWTIDVGGTIDLNSKSKKDKEMYLEAAYFIQLQMAGLPTKSSLEKKDESELPKYDSFFNNFTNYLSLTYYGGNPIRTQEDWNILDERNPNTGLRGTDKRVKRLSDYLKAYSNSLKEGKYNFEGSPFKNLTDLKTRINNAITKLDDGTWNLDDTDALNAIGLRSSDWFNNGSGDTFIADDRKEYTYGNYYGKILPALKKEEAEALAKAKAQKEAEKKAAELAAYQNKTFIKILKANFPGTTAEQLKEKYGGDLNQLIAALNLYSQSNARDLNPDLKRELFGAMKLAKDNVSDNFYKKLISNPAYRGSARNRFKVIKGVDNYIYDIKTGNIIQVLNRELFENGNNSNLFSGVKTDKEKEQDYLNSKIPGMTNAEWKELMAIGSDVVSIIDPEPFSAAGFGIGAAGLRHAAKNETPGHKWNFWEGVGLGLDYLTGAIGAIPLAGDLVLGTKTLIKGADALPKITKALRLAGRAGATKDLWDGFTNGGSQTVSKILNGEDLTVQDWRNIGQIIRGLAATHSLNVGNRAVKKVAEKSGLLTEASSSVVNKLGWAGRKGRELGFFSSRVKGNETIPTLKVRKTSEDGKIDEMQIDLNPKLRKELGNTNPSKLEAKAKELGVKIPEGYKIETNNITGWGAKIKNSINPLASKNKDIFGTRTDNTTRGDDEFETWLENRGILSKIAYGYNPRLEAIRKGLGITTPKSTPTGLLSENPKVTETPKATETSEKSIAELRKSVKGYLEGTAKHSGNNLSEEPFKAGDFNFEVNKFPNSSAGNIDISFNGNVKNISFKNQEDMMKKVAEFLKENRRLKDASGTFIKKINAKEMGEILKLLKAKGVFKQGGTINRLKIQKYKEFIKK